MPPSAVDKLALYYEAEAYNMAGEKIMGRQAAGAGFMKALVAQQPRQLWCYARSRATAESFVKDVRGFGGGKIEMRWVEFLKPDRLAEAGLLYRPDPSISHDAWRRLNHAGPRAYSLCGVTHTTASHAVMETLAGLPTAPLEDWDAVICTSRAVRDSVRTVVDNAVAYLRERVGATRLTLPQLPVIPLGVHCDDFTATEQEKAEARRALGISPDQVVVLFVGRLTFAGKAHPLPMYLGLEACAKEAPITLLQAGWFANDAIERTFKAEAQALCPSVRSQFVDGRDPNLRRQAWAAADIFTSLSDNIQETFGLTPVEAMAAGLPVVVTDWNGYRDTVRDGIDGFRVPTLTLPPGSGDQFADRHDLNLDNYDHYSGINAQLVAVDVPAVTEAYRKLIRDPALRRKMGQSGAEHARATFDWSVVMRSYAELWRELNERRRSNADLYPPLTRRRRPDRPDPFSMFASYPTVALSPGIRFRRLPGVDVAAALARREMASIRFAVPLVAPAPLVERLVETVAAEGWMTVEEVVAKLPGFSRDAVERALVWMAKVGVLAFSAK